MFTKAFTRDADDGDETSNTTNPVESIDRQSFKSKNNLNVIVANIYLENRADAAHNCTELKILNMARTKGKILEHLLIQATNIVELNLRETLINDQLFVLISKSVPKLGILNVSRCYNLTNLAIEKSSFPSLRFLGIAYCMFSIEAIICAIDKHGICAICVRGIKLQNEDISRLIEFYPDVADISIPTLCGLPEGTVSQEALPQLCPYCCSSFLATILSAKDANDGSWMEL